MRDLVKEFLDIKTVEAGSSLNTVQAYASDMEQYIKAIHPVLPQHATKETILTFLKSLSDADSRPKTLARKISCIREFYKFLQSENIIDINPAYHLHTPKIGKPLPSFLTQSEISKLCEVLSQKKDFSFMRMKVMIKLMSSSGLRVSEVVSLPENAINYDLHQILIFGKGSKERIVPVTKELIQDVLEYIDYRTVYLADRKSKWLFPSIKSVSGHMTRSGFFKSLKKIAIEAGLDAAKVHPHVLRHSFATCLVNKSVDLRSIQKMLGHENIATTEIYTHITTEKLAQEVYKHHPLMHPQK
ncbi:MAG: tyrosine recombinase [Alphaproteobacteria bacterium]|nr:tyrosine recombinase [Alphaproteobacteria bacterium]